MFKLICTTLAIACMSTSFIGCTPYQKVELDYEERRELERQNRIWLEDQGIAPETMTEEEERLIMEKYHEKLGEQYDYIRKNRVRLLETDE